MRMYELLYSDLNGDNKKRMRVHAYSMVGAASDATKLVGENAKFLSITLIED